ncbi:hypothetical protein [Streptomyces sp. NPDC093225]|uniref:hypothetical protein n=1 Tax=Streptomyces sp. NPDC093225 TaxID=3366034 RepID=UPI003816B142
MAVAALAALGPSVTATAAQASAPAAARPAPAAEPPIRLEAPATNVALGGRWQLLDVLYDNPGADYPDPFTVTADFAGIAGFAKAEFEEPEQEDCKVTGTKVTCTGSAVLRGGARGRLATIVVRTLPGAKVGDRGTVKISAHVRGRTVKGVDARVEAGGPDLEMKMPDHDPRPEPGARIPLPFTLTNKGTEPVTDVLLTAEATYGLKLGLDHRNCAYRRGPMDYVGGEDAYLDALMNMSATYQCRIKGTFLPGRSYRLALPAGIRVAAYASGSERFFLRVDEDNAGNRTAWRGGRTVRTGTGPELKFKTVAVAAPTGVGDTGRDTNRYNSHYFGTVSVAGGADFAAVGTTVRGGAGTTVRATVKLRNQGPAYFLSAREVQGILKLPKGVSVVKADPACRPRERADGTVAYHWCEVVPPGGRIFVKPGDEFAYTFTLKLEQTLKDVSGSFSTRFLADTYLDDPDHRNDSARIRVNPSRS